MEEIDPHEIARQVVMALVLEPIAEKRGCTTRTYDLKETIKLQHLQAAGINVGRFFYEMADRVKTNKGNQPESYFDLALEALGSSRMNLENGGKLINQGLIAMMSHVVVSGLMTDGDGVAVCRVIPEVLKRSS